MKRTMTIAALALLAAGALGAQAQTKTPSASMAAPVSVGDRNTGRRVMMLDKSLSSIANSEAITDDQKKQLKVNLQALSNGPKPDETVVDQVTNSLAEILHGNKIPSKQCTELSEALGTVMNSAFNTVPVVRQSTAKVKSILTDAGVPSDQIDPLMKGLEKLAEQK